MIKIRPLKKSDNRKTLRTGNPDLDRFFIRYAGQNQFRHHVGTTYVAEENGVLIGFATVSASHIKISDLPQEATKRLPRYPLPILRLARLGVAQTAQGRGIGLKLLIAIFEIAYRMADLVGCLGIMVDAKPEAVGFYTKYGFKALDLVQGKLGDRPQPIPMYLSLSAIPDPRHVRSTSSDD